MAFEFSCGGYPGQPYLPNRRWWGQPVDQTFGTFVLDAPAWYVDDSWGGKSIDLSGRQAMLLLAGNWQDPQFDYRGLDYPDALVVRGEFPSIGNFTPICTFNYRMSIFLLGRTLCAFADGYLFSGNQTVPEGPVELRFSYAAGSKGLQPDAIGNSGGSYPYRADTNIATYMRSSVNGADKQFMIPWTYQDSFSGGSITGEFFTKDMPYAINDLNAGWHAGVPGVLINQCRVAPELISLGVIERHALGSYNYSYPVYINGRAKINHISAAYRGNNFIDTPTVTDEEIFSCALYEPDPNDPNYGNFWQNLVNTEET